VLLTALLTIDPLTTVAATDDDVELTATLFMLALSPHAVYVNLDLILQSPVISISSARKLFPNYPTYTPWSIEKGTTFIFFK